ncbi:hypothetical protein AW169_08760 [Corynebacterium stationis]|nr:hypothetical protein AW169_08760 [Corynebacterium stationis]
MLTCPAKTIPIGAKRFNAELRQLGWMSPLMLRLPIILPVMLRVTTWVKIVILFGAITNLPS